MRAECAALYTDARRYASRVSADVQEEGTKKTKGRGQSEIKRTPARKGGGKGKPAESDIRLRGTSNYTTPARQEGGGDEGRRDGA